MEVRVKRKLTAKQKDGNRLVAHEKASIMHDKLTGNIDKKTQFYKTRKEARLEIKRQKRGAA